MQAIEDLSATHLRPDRTYHPLVREWVGWRQMYMNIAPNIAVPRAWVSWPLREMREGSIGGLSMAFNWIYGPGVARDLQFTPKQIDLMYRECFKRAAQSFLNRATQTSEMGYVHQTTTLIEDARICVAAVEVEFDEGLASGLVGTSMQVGLPKTLELLNRETDRRTNFDYYFVRTLYREAWSYADQVGVCVTRQTNLAEHRLTFTKPS